MVMNIQVPSKEINFLNGALPANW